MPRTCTVCTHEERVAIDAALVRGQFDGRASTRRDCDVTKRKRYGHRSCLPFQAGDCLFQIGRCGLSVDGRCLQPLMSQQPRESRVL
jgi:hypothetical protein